MDPDLGQSEVDRSRAHGPTITDIRRRLQTLVTYRDSLVRFARRRRANVHDAEDLAQLAIIRVATSATFNDRAGDPWPYLVRTMANLVAEHYRRKASDDAKNHGIRAPPTVAWSRTSSITRWLRRRFFVSLRPSRC